jgi:tripartite-type tricarboxylate transporter receptor subunit TctC
MKTVLRTIACSAAFLLGGLCQAQTGSYPSQPVRLIVPFAAGGPTDVIARVVAQKLTESMGQQFFVENLPGVGGNTGTARAAKSPANGYTLCVTSTGFIVNPLLYVKGVPYDPVKDFAPITLVAASPNLLSVHPSVPVKTVQDLIALVKTNPGKYSFAQPATGSTPHLNGESFKLEFRLDLTMVPFNGAAPAVVSTVGGHTPIAFTALPSAITQVRDGKLRALAVLSDKRANALPDVPTAAEAGIPGHEGDTLTGLVAPAGTPRDVVEKLYAEVRKMAALPDVKEKLEALGFSPVANRPEKFGERIRTESTRWAKVIREAKIAIE